MITFKSLHTTVTDGNPFEGALDHDPHTINAIRWRVDLRFSLFSCKSSAPSAVSTSHALLALLCQIKFGLMGAQQCARPWPPCTLNSRRPGAENHLVASKRIKLTTTRFTRDQTRQRDATQGSARGAPVTFFVFFLIL